MKYLRLMAGFFAGTSALAFIYVGEYAVAAGMIGTMLGFFVGEANGRKEATEETG